MLEWEKIATDTYRIRVKGRGWIVRSHSIGMNSRSEALIFISDPPGTWEPETD